MILGTYYLTYGPEDEELDGDRPGDVRAEGARVPLRAGGRAGRTSTSIVELHDVGAVPAEWVEGGHIAHHRRAHHLQRQDRARAGGDDGRGVRPLAVPVHQQVPAQARHDAVRRRRSCRRSAPSAISQVLDAFKDLGFRYATQAGITISKNDVVVPPSKQEILAKYEERVRRPPGAVRGRPDHAGGAPPGGHRSVERGDRRGRRGHDREHPEDRPAELHLHDGQLGRPWLLQADPPAGGHARPDGQPEGRDHRAPREGELHGRPRRASSTSPRRTAPARASRTRRCVRRTRAT